MAVDPTIVQAIYAFSSVSSVVLAYVAWGHREKTGASPLLVAIAAGWWWATALFAASVISAPGISAWLVRSVFVAVVVSVPAVLALALEYTGREHLVNRRTIALLAIEPVIVIVLAFVQPADLFFESLVAAPGTLTGVEVTYGIAFLLHTAYSYVLTLAVVALVLDLAFRTKAMYRGQLAALLGAVFVPLLANAIAIFGLVDFDSSPAGIFAANALYTVAITRYRLIDLVPIARDRVVGNIRDAVFVVDTDDRIVDVNPAGEALAEEFVGASTIVGRNARNLLGAVPHVDELYDDIVAGDEARTVEYAIGGGHYQAEATPIDDDRGLSAGWLFLVRDVTEQKRREQQLRERNEQLDKFASVVSHDLRNPLQVARGRVELARETGDVSHLEAVETAHDRMEAIIDDVLSLARSGDSVTDLSPVSLFRAVQEAWDTVETTGAALETDVDARVTADSDRLSRLLENLFRNAIEHGTETSPDPDRPQIVEDSGSDGATLGETADEDSGSERAPAVTVEAGLVRSDGDPVGFYVADDGPGIPPEDRETVFESGFSTSAEGTGFGLTIVSQIAEAHGWSVTASESESGGARFEITGVEVVST